MKSNDLTKTREALRIKLQEAITNDDAEAFAGAFDELQQCIGDELRADFEQRICECTGLNHSV